jgi:hypothetical protein
LSNLPLAAALAEREIVPASPATYGTAATLDEAKAKLRAAWEKAKCGRLILPFARTVACFVRVIRAVGRRGARSTRWRRSIAVPFVAYVLRD